MMLFEYSNYILYVCLAAARSAPQLSDFWLPAAGPGLYSAIFQLPIAKTSSRQQCPTIQPRLNTSAHITVTSHNLTMPVFFFLSLFCYFNLKLFFLAEQNLIIVREDDVSDLRREMWKDFVRDIALVHISVSVSISFYLCFEEGSFVCLIFTKLIEHGLSLLGNQAVFGQFGDTPVVSV